VPFYDRLPPARVQEARQASLFAAGRYGIERPAYSRNAPETSKQAASAIEPIVAQLEARCLQELGKEGLTCDELELILRWSHQTASARINRLMKKGLIQDSGERRPTRTGRPAVVWRAR
jgi:predicted HTH transcriptional regulator